MWFMSISADVVTEMTGVSKGLAFLKASSEAVSRSNAFNVTLFDS